MTRGLVSVCLKSPNDGWYSRYWLKDPTSKRTALVTSQEKRNDCDSAIFQSLTKLMSTPK